MTPTKIHGIGAAFEEVDDALVFHLDRPFDIDANGRRRLLLTDVADLVKQASGWLAAVGVEANGHVAILKRNHFDSVLLACAAARLGALPVMLSPALDVDTQHALVRSLSTPFLVTTSDVLLRARAAGSDLIDDDRRVLVLDGDVDGAVSVDSVRGHAVPSARPRRPSDPMMVTHTSGTTGTPKLVVHSAETAIGQLGRTESIRWPLVGTKRADVTAACLSFVHGRAVPWTVGLLTLRPRSAVIISDSAPLSAVTMLGAHQPTVVETHPNIFLRWEHLTRVAPLAFSRTRLFINTFDAIHPRTVRSFLAASKRQLPVWLQGWGQSEVGPLCFRLYGRRSVRDVGRRNPVTREVGVPIPFRARVRIADPTTGRRVKRGSKGMILARTDALCLTYLGEQDRWTNKVLGKWWNTGDVGQRAWWGGVKLLDREVDEIPGVSGIELEDILLDRLPAATEIVVLGVPGRLPVPILCMEEGTDLDTDAWHRATADLPRMERPVQVAWDEMPWTGTWKVRRPELRRRLFGDSAAFGTGRWT